VHQLPAPAVQEEHRVGATGKVRQGPSPPALTRQDWGHLKMDRRGCRRPSPQRLIEEAEVKVRLLREKIRVMQEKEKHWAYKVACSFLESLRVRSSDEAELPSWSLQAELTRKTWMEQLGVYKLLKDHQMPPRKTAQPDARYPEACHRHHLLTRAHELAMLTGREQRHGGFGERPDAGLGAEDPLIKKLRQEVGLACFAGPLRRC
jgi:hypothetical protein